MKAKISTLSKGEFKGGNMLVLSKLAILIWWTTIPDLVLCTMFSSKMFFQTKFQIVFQNVRMHHMDQKVRIYKNKSVLLHVSNGK